MLFKAHLRIWLPHQLLAAAGIYGSNHSDLPNPPGLSIGNKTLTLSPASIGSSKSLKSPRNFTNSSRPSPERALDAWLQPCLNRQTQTFIDDSCCP